MGPHGTSCNEIEAFKALRNVAHPGPKHGGVSQMQPPDYLRKKGRFLLICLEQSDFQFRNNHRDGNAWKTSSGANVGEPTIFNGHAFYRKKTFTKMELDDLFRPDHCSERDLLIPKKEQRNIILNLTA